MILNYFFNKGGLHTKKFFAILAAIVLCIPGCIQAEENRIIEMYIDDPIIRVNGTEKEIDTGFGTAPVIMNGRTIVPIRTIIEEMGAKAEWNSAYQTVTLYSKDNIIKLRIDSILGLYGVAALQRHFLFSLSLLSYSEQD